VKITSAVSSNSTSAAPLSKARKESPDTGERGA
jgi:hypothetical protein